MHTHKQVFLETLVQHICQQNPNNTEQVVVVLPSRRACMYFSLYFAQQLEEVAFLPEVLAFDDFIEKHATIIVPDNIVLVYQMYEAFKQIYLKHAQDLKENNLLNKMQHFDHFVPIGYALLADFELIEKNIISEQFDDLFEFLSQEEALKRWQFEHKEQIEISQHVHDFFDFWEVASELFYEFKKKLALQGLGFKGMLINHVLENVDNWVSQRAYKKIVFAGLDKLNKSEIAIIKKLQDLKIAQIIWDYDRFYFEDPNHQAGLHLRKNTAFFQQKNDPFLRNQILKNNTKLSVFQVDTITAQAKLVGDLLDKFAQQAIHDNSLEHLQKTNSLAILLPDESVLIPLLGALPDKQYVLPNGTSFNITDFINVTIGLNIKQSAFYSLISHIFELQNNKIFSKGIWKYYYKDVLRILYHPYFRKPSKKDKDSPTLQPLDLIIDIGKSNKVYISQQDFGALAMEYTWIKSIFTPWNKHIENQTIDKYFFEYFDVFVNTLLQIVDKQTGFLEGEFIAAFSTLVKKLEFTLEDLFHKMAIRTFKNILFEALKHHSIPFTSEPIAPIQIMGVLESRALDFEQVMILSCNEGVFPKNKQIDSLIPFQVKLHFDLPTYIQNDASTSYHFYRLLHCAEKLTMIYIHSALPKVNKPAEVSRFVAQLKESLDLPCEFMALSWDLPTMQFSENSIEKDAHVMQLIDAFVANPVSSTALAAYMKSPYNFFKNNILSLRGEMQVFESLEAQGFGKVLHAILENIFKPLIGKKIDKSHFEALLADKENIEALVTKAFREHVGQASFDKGKNLMLFEVAKLLVVRMLQNDIAQNLHLVILATELSLEADFYCADGRKIVLTGQIDRIDLLTDPDGHKIIRIVDYKTGRLPSGKIKAGDFEQFMSNTSKAVDYITQLLIYKFLLLSQMRKNNFCLSDVVYSENFAFEADFFFLKNIREGMCSARFDNEPLGHSDWLEQTQQHLQAIFAEIFDPNIAFTLQRK